MVEGEKKKGLPGKLTITSEMVKLEIKPEYFEIIYTELKDNNRLLPADSAVPWDQYQKIVNYLRDKTVLGEDNKVQEEGRKVFDFRLELERRLEKVLNSSPLDPFHSSGGITSCRRNNRYGSNGGITSCRNYD